MPVSRIEQIIGGVITATAMPTRGGDYRCYERGKNMDPSRFKSLDDAASYLRSVSGSGIRMTRPGDDSPGVIIDHIHIDGVPR